MTKFNQSQLRVGDFCDTYLHLAYVSINEDFHFLNYLHLEVFLVGCHTTKESPIWDFQNWNTEQKEWARNGTSGDNWASRKVE